MGLKDTVQHDLTAAVRTRDDVRKRPLRVIMALIHSAEARDATPERPVARDLPDEEILELLDAEASRRRRAIGTYEQRGLNTEVETELAELAVIEAYLDQTSTR